MSARDDDDWVGTPPEGRITRDRAKPDFWRQNFKAVTISSGVLGLLLVVVLVVALA